MDFPAFPRFLRDLLYTQEMEKINFLPGMLVLLICCCATTNSAKAPSVPLNAGAREASLTKIRLFDLHHQPIVLRDETLQNKQSVLLLNFWATFCDPCKEKMPKLEELFQHYRAQGLRVINISLDPAETRDLVSSFIEEKKFSFEVCIDEQQAAAANFNPQKKLPYLLVFDRAGRQIYEKAEMTSADWPVLEAIIKQALR